MVVVAEVLNDDGDKNYFYKTLYGKRYPTSFLYKKGARAEGNRKTLQDPLLPQIKLLIEDAWRGDPVVRVGTNKVAQFILGKRTKTILEATKAYIKEIFTKDTTLKAVADAEKQANEEMQTNREYQSALLDVETIDEEVGLRAKLEAMLVQKTMGGRAALFVEKTENSMPVDLKVLSWQRLGQVYVNSDSWQLEEVQYDDETLFEDGTPTEDRKLSAEDLLYFTNSDFGMTPNSIHYGYSQAEPIAMISEANRLIDEVDIKEMVRTSYSGFGLLQIESRNDAEIRKFLKEYKAGKWMATNLKVNPMVMQLMSNMQQILDVRSGNDSRIMGALELPSFLLAGFENITNRATAYGVLYAWQESVLTEKRTELRDQLEPQWYKSIRDNILISQGVDPVNAAYKIRMTFEDITFETLGDKATTLLPLYQAGVIPITKLLDLLDMPELKEEMEAKIEEQNKLREQMQKDMINAQAKAGAAGAAGKGQTVTNNKGVENANPNVKPPRPFGLMTAADVLVAAMTKSEFDLAERKQEEVRVQEAHKIDMEMKKNRAEFIKIVTKEIKAGTIDINGKVIKKNVTDTSDTE